MAAIIRDESHNVGSSFRVHVRIMRARRPPAHPEGFKYRLVLLDDEDVRLICLDNHGGHGHHLHCGKTVRRYAFRGVERLLADFWKLVEEATR